ncbi:hypothetical protein C5167_031462 [Papaver somniferum]|uniref:Uncharacterized protein n=1 Tax=Papaver somniferum TaxID=3469 RepID=A0A4Y7K785_PAPSO|nr:hypothetical protein C5167_031462 [Papaver somniferum]
MATQLECLGYEFAKWMGVRTLEEYIYYTHQRTHCRSSTPQLKESPDSESPIPRERIGIVIRIKVSDPLRGLVLNSKLRGFNRYANCQAQFIFQKMCYLAKRVLFLVQMDG